MKAKPFLKWAGGKTQLIDKIREKIPAHMHQNSFTYIEPFVGSGAVLFWILQEFENIEKAVINDINRDLINTYRSIRSNPYPLIKLLDTYEQEYHRVYSKRELAKEYYYEKRTIFNGRNSDKITQSALFIFLNKTCFNGLYRVNKKNQFNVPIGRSKMAPSIYNEKNLLKASKLLQKVVLLNDDYTKTLEYAEENSLFYFDPPYKPISKSALFNAYAQNEFNDDEQRRLSEFCNTLNQLNHKWILSNSDVKNTDPDDQFFDQLYQPFQIDRVWAKRSINSDGEKRGVLTELLIHN